MFTFPFLEALTKQLSTTALDESYDVLSCFVTAFIFLFSALLITALSHVGNAIECWLPQTYSLPWEQFAEDYCFQKDTYWYPTTNSDMHDFNEAHKEQHTLRYYQWTSMYLTIACIVSMLPKFLWKQSQSFTDMPILYFCNTAKAIRQEAPDQRKAKVKEMANLLHSKITAQHAPYTFTRIRPINVYIFIKMLYLLSALCQFAGLAVFLGQEDQVFWGWELAKNLYNGVTWETTGIFPRIVFCDFFVRQLAGNNQEETIQCFLGVNEFNEKIFLFLWFWLLILFFLTFIGAIFSFLALRSHFLIRNLLHTIYDRYDMQQKKEFTAFAEYLTTDAILVLSYVKSQSDVVANELAFQMWKIFQSAEIKANNIKLAKLADKNIEIDVV